MDLDLRLVRYFVAVADELHFGRAAARLYISQPALSKQVRKLEDQLGAPLLVRDSRHVTLTPRGQRFLDDARQLLAVADRMARPAEDGVLRIAHIFELATSRTVAAAFAAEYPGIRLVERSMDSHRQFQALLNDQLDLGVLRVTAQLQAERPSGWHHELLRLEPLLLIGRPGDEPRDQVSLYERPIEVFADTPDSGMYNAHGDYLTTFERHARLTLRWLGNPGIFEQCLAAVTRARDAAYVLEFESLAVRYAEAGLPVYRPAELQPHYPWSIAWRDEIPSGPVRNVVAVARRTAKNQRWHELTETPVRPPLWIPPEDPVSPGSRS
ncbi:LysR family transcriptional regulator [Kribbella sp.]|uniref:LysR family transcriptional regulator n=1 Tax=Kribbella sp. TaxID=1871183 RepID=UPI002D4C8938|nr:LysR family transcriptional regulator [Kribbella sp.]HZX03052.1 LysR family transcriptional regulator [Kribbella sp.]